MSLRLPVIIDMFIGLPKVLEYSSKIQSELLFPHVPLERSAEC